MKGRKEVYTMKSILYNTIVYTMKSMQEGSIYHEGYHRDIQYNIKYVLRKVLVVEGSSVVKVFLLSSRRQFRILGSIYVYILI